MRSQNWVGITLGSCVRFTSGNYVLKPYRGIKNK